MNVKDVVKLQKALNNVFFGQNKRWANIARFDRFREVRKDLLKELDDGKKSAEVGGKNKSKNNAEIEKIEKKNQKIWEEKISRKIVLKVKKLLGKEKIMREDICLVRRRSYKTGT